MATRSPPFYFLLSVYFSFSIYIPLTGGLKKSQSNVTKASLSTVTVPDFPLVRKSLNHPENITRGHDIQFCIESCSLQWNHRKSLLMIISQDTGEFIPCDLWTLADLECQVALGCLALHLNPVSIDTLLSIKNTTIHFSFHFYVNLSIKIHQSIVG